jgi:hypothetical protein
VLCRLHRHHTEMSTSLGFRPCAAPARAGA